MRVGYPISGQWLFISRVHNRPLLFSYLAVGARRSTTMYHHNVYSQRGYTEFNGYPYADNYIRQVDYNNMESNTYYQGNYQQEQYSIYRGQQRGTYEHRAGQESPYISSQQDRNCYIPPYNKQYDGYTNISLQNSLICNNGLDNKSNASAMMSRASYSESNDNMFFPPCALQYCETDGESNEDDEVIEPRNSCVYAKSYPEGSYRFHNERGIRNLFVIAYIAD